MLLKKPVKSDKIKPALVLRDELGFFSHPDCPLWEEGEPVETIVAWFLKNDGRHYTDFMEDSGTVEMINAWFDDCNPWQPVCGYPNAFILSIHDTDNGPVALWFIPNEEK